MPNGRKKPNISPFTELLSPEDKGEEVDQGTLIPQDSEGDGGPPEVLERIGRQRITGGPAPPRSSFTDLLGEDVVGEFRELGRQTPVRIRHEHKSALERFLDETFGEGEVGDALTAGYVNVVNIAQQIVGSGRKLLRDSIELATGSDISDEDLYRELNIPIPFTDATVNPAFNNRLVEGWIEGHSSAFKPLPPTGVLSRAPRALHEYADPRRWVQQLLSQGPASLAQMGAIIYNPILGSALVGASEYSSFTDTVQRMENRTGQRVNPVERVGYGLALAATIPVLERIGFGTWASMARKTGLANKLLALAFTGTTEALTEETQEISTLTAEEAIASGSLATGASRVANAVAHQIVGTELRALGVDEQYWNTPEDLVERVKMASYGGLVVGVGFGVGGNLIAKVPFSNVTDGDAKLYDYQADDQGILRPRFRVDNPKSNLFGEIVDTRTLIDNGLLVPEHRVELFREQLRRMGKFSNAMIEATVRAQEKMWQANGTSFEEFLKVSGLALSEGEAQDTDLFQANTNGPIWVSRIGAAVANLDGLPKRASARTYLSRLKKEVQKGKFSQAELEWSGMEAFLDGDEEVSREEVIEFAQNYGLTLDELTAIPPRGRSATAVADRTYLRGLIALSGPSKEVRAINRRGAQATDQRVLNNSTLAFTVLNAAEHDHNLFMRLWRSKGVSTRNLSYVLAAGSSLVGVLPREGMETLADYVKTELDWMRENTADSPSPIGITTGLTVILRSNLSQVEHLEMLEENRSFMEQYFDPDEITDIESILSSRPDSDLEVEGDIPTQYQQYSLPGGERYREYVLILPTDPKSRGRMGRIERLQFAIRDLDAQIREQGVAPIEATGDLKAQRDVLERELAQIQIRDPHSTFPSRRAHHPADNVLAHIRVDERTVDGERVLFVHELQSDWAQKGRKAGVAPEGVDLDVEAARRERNIVDKLGEARDKLSDALDPLLPILNFNFLADHRSIGASELATRTKTAIQSDWAQKSLSSEDISNLESLIKEIDNLKDSLKDMRRAGGPVPLSPYLSTNRWVKLALRRLTRVAADAGISTIVINNGATAQQFSFGDLEGQQTFYDEIVPQAVKKEFGSDGVDTVTMDVDPTAREIQEGRGTGTREFTRIRLSPEQTSAALAGIHLPQVNRHRGESILKGYTRIVEDTEAIVGILEKGDFSTLMHELFHVYRNYMNPDLLAKLEKAMGMEDSNWTIPREEQAARFFEALLAQGKLKNPDLQHFVDRFRQWMADAYGVIVGSEIDIDIPQEVEDFFINDVFGHEDAMGEQSAIETKHTWWGKFLDYFDVERSFRKAGAPETGLHIKNVYTEIIRHVHEGARVYRNIFRDFKSDEKILDLLLLYEDKLASGETFEGIEDAKTRRALEVIHKYFEESLFEYKLHGGLEKGFVEQAKSNLELAVAEEHSDMFNISPDGIHKNETKLEQLKQKVRDGDEAAAAKLQDFQEKLKLFDRLENTRYVHIPLALFEQYTADNIDLAINILKVLADVDRKTIRLSDLLKENGGPLEKKDIKASEIFASYSHRKGKDLSLLKIREAAHKEGMIRLRKEGRKTGVSDPFWYDPESSTFTRQPIFKGYELNRPMQEWLKSVTDRKGPIGTVRRWFNLGKVMAFYNPLILNSYNLIQLALGAGLSAARPKYWLRAYDNMYRNPFSERARALEEAGLRSQPFSLPWKGESGVKAMFNRLQRGGGVGKDVMTTVAFGIAAAGVSAAAGGPIGTAALIGMGIKAARPLQALSDAVKGKGRYQDPFKDIARMPVTMLRNFYSLAWDTAWMFDDFQRHVLAEYYIDQGLTVQEAAQRSAKILGDYASVPVKTRKTLNLLLFTPTYKIAMAKMIGDSIGAWGRVIEGDANVDAKHSAKVLLNMLAIVVGFDVLMAAMGWDRDLFGRRYTKSVTSTGEDSIVKGEPREIAITWGGPHDLFYKFYLRGRRSLTDPTVISPLQDFVRQNEWEFHPFNRLALDYYKNEDRRTGEDIVKFGDGHAQALGRMAKYAGENIIGIIGAVAGEDMSPEGIRLFRQEYGELTQLLTGTITFQFARDPEDIRNAKRIQRLTQQFNEAVKPGLDDLHRMSKKEFDEWLNSNEIQESQREYVSRLNRLLLEMDEDKYGMPGLYHDSVGPMTPWR